MDMATFFAVTAFVTATTITPGPNSIMIMASGVNFGFRRTSPHVLGVAAGVMMVIALAGLGLGRLFIIFPLLHGVLLLLSAGYLLYLAWKIANAVPPGSAVPSGQPLTFFQAAAFQWVNPKVWALGVTAVAFYVPEASPHWVLAVAVIFAVIGLASNSLWAWPGTLLRNWLSGSSRLRNYNRVSALLLIASLYPALERFFLLRS